MISVKIMYDLSDYHNDLAYCPGNICVGVCRHFWRSNPICRVGYSEKKYAAYCICVE